MGDSSAGAPDGGAVDNGAVDNGAVDNGAVDNAGAAGAAGTEDEQWTTLFNGENLDGWTVSRGNEPGQTAEEIFQVTDGMLHVYKGAAQGSAQSIATIRTNDSYGNYVFQFEYMWATNRFVPRANVVPDRVHGGPATDQAERPRRAPALRRRVSRAAP
jgi:hypothetical protein